MPLFVHRRSERLWVVSGVNRLSHGNVRLGRGRLQMDPASFGFIASFETGKVKGRHQSISALITCLKVA